MRELYNAQLEQLANELIAMGALCENAISMAIKSFIDAEADLVDKTRACEVMIDEKNAEIERLCLKLLLKQAPVATDFRMISSALKMITDLERIGDQAADIAELSAYTGGSIITEELRTMANEVIGMVTNAVDSFVRKDEAVARAVMAHDDVVDGIFETVKAQIIASIKADEAEANIDMMMIAKYLERIADHATNIAEWTVYAVTGVHPN